MDNLGQALWAARTGGSRLSKDAFAALKDRDAAYAVQAAGAEAAGLTPAGWKVAATSDAALKLLAVDGPAMGPVFKEHLFESPATMPAVAAHGAGIECEIAFVMATPVVEPGAGRETVIAAVRHPVIAVEVVGCRVDGGFAGAGTMVMIGDFAFNAALVTGREIENWRSVDLAAVQARAVVNEEVKAEGTGAAVLGDPVEALIWAANEAIRIGRPLRAGDIVSTGSMTGVTAVKSGDRAVGDFGGLGTVEIQFT